jgi:hypothetical protein
VTITSQGTNVRLLRLTYGAASNARIDVGTLPGGTGNFNFNLPAHTVTTSFFVRQAAPGAGTTVPLTVVDSCGEWPTFVGGGPAAFASGTPTPTATPPPPVAAPAAPTATATTVPAGPSGGSSAVASAASPSATATARPAVCAPRPPVAVASAPTGDGRLRVTITASAAANATLQALRVNGTTNALVDLGPPQPPNAGGSVVGASGSFNVPLAAGAREVTLYVRRATAGQASTVSLVVTDSCGEWPSTVRGGPGAF